MSPCSRHTNFTNGFCSQKVSFVSSAGPNKMKCWMTQGFSDPYRKPLNGLNSICREYLSTVTPGGSEGKECLQCGRPEINPWVGKIPRRRKCQPIPVFLLGEFHGWRSLAGYSPWGCKELDTTERLPLHCLSQWNIGYNSEEMLCGNRTMKWTGLFHLLCNPQHRTRASTGRKEEMVRLKTEN